MRLDKQDRQKKINQEKPNKKAKPTKPRHRLISPRSQLAADAIIINQGDIVIKKIENIKAIITASRRQ